MHVQVVHITLDIFFILYRLEIIGPENQILRMSAKTTRLKNGLEIRRILNGMWQVSGTHGRIDPQLAGLICDYIHQYTRSCHLDRENR